MLEKASLRLRFALFFAALGLAGTAAFAAALWFAWQRTGGAADGYVVAGLLGSFALIGLSVWVGMLFDENVAKPILGLAGDLQARALSDVEAGIDQNPGRYLGSLAPAARAIHDALAEARREHTRSVEEKTAALAREKALLEVLVRDLSQAVLVVSPEGRVMLFNEAAEDLFSGIGLDRPIARYLNLAPIDAHLCKDTPKADRAPRSFLTSRARDAHLISGTMADFGTPDALLGHVLVCDLVTDRLQADAASDKLVSDLLDQVRRPAMNIGAMIDVLDADAPSDTRLTGQTERIRGELGALTKTLSAAATTVQDQTARNWPRQSGTVQDITQHVSSHHVGLPAGQKAATPVFCDIFFFSQLVAKITARVTLGETRGDLVWDATQTGHGAVQLILSWQGEGFAQTALDAVLDEAAFDAYGSYTVAQVLNAHRADMWISGRNRIVLEVPCDHANRLPRSETRRDFFDFTGACAGMASDRLQDLSYVVFDTETTGLDPVQDDVVQIAGVRILRGNLLAGDSFDALVSPGRNIPAGATEIHGITNSMVADAPRFIDVGSDFAEFSEDAVLVAHNASFDCAFLDRLPGQGGPRFDHPTLCTARLSLALNPHLNDHTLDALADRYDVNIDDGLRHTALGDASA
ncbi:MAG: exonuclease domain-containing protein, partial [Pseudomonadota bacterium]